MKPLLSICIPTYGHDLDLRSALTVLTGLPTFRENEDIEVVISDNCSPVIIGEGATVPANAIVTRDIPPDTSAR